MYTAKDIRNLALLGHGGDGKSALCESMLYVTKAITRLGKRADGTTVSDFDDEEKKRQYSIKTSVIPVEFGGCKLNVLDNPGYFDFAAEIVQSLRVAAGALPCAGWAAGFGASAFFGSGFFACGATANTCSSEAIWCFCVIASNTTFSCSSVSTCVLLRGFSKYFPTISAISFGVTPKSAATSFTRYFTKLIFSPPPD